MDTSDDVSIDVIIVTEHHNEAQKQAKVAVDDNVL